MNVLIFRGTNDIDGIDYAIDFIQKGDTVFVIQCDGSIGVCPWNSNMNSLCCKYCHAVSVKSFKKLCPKGYEYVSMGSLITEEDRKKSRDFTMDFNSIAEMKSILYNNVEVGFGAFSSYATASRNVMPNITQEFKNYIFYMIRMEICVYEAVNRYVNNNKIELIIFHNGRFAMYRPFLGVAKNNHISYIATEHYTRNGVKYKNDFINDVPHSVKGNIDKAVALWNSIDEETRLEKGRGFYEKRRHGIAAGDKVYIKKQVADKLPDDWNDELENIAIFNSSEDEFCAISKEMDDMQLFPNQYVALHSIFEHYKDDKKKHFYLRIHPNLIDVPYISHMALYDLEYDNVTILPPDSPISSYALMDKADKIIVFNSTMGLESAYWGKPVIALTKFYASELNLAYYSETTDGLWVLINDEQLEPLKNSNAEMMGNYFLRATHPYKHIDIKMTINHRGEKYPLESVTQCLGSYKLFYIVFRFFNKLHGFSNFSKFKKLPETIGQ